MEMHSLFIDWKNYYRQNDVPPKALYRFNAVTLKITHFSKS